jgi:hypothetical protein
MARGATPLKSIFSSMDFACRCLVSNPVIIAWTRPRRPAECNLRSKGANNNRLKYEEKSGKRKIQSNHGVLICIQLIAAVPKR